MPTNRIRKLPRLFRVIGAGVAATNKWAHERALDIRHLRAANIDVETGGQRLERTAAAEWPVSF
jgi:hypothetical protein